MSELSLYSKLKSSQIWCLATAFIIDLCLCTAECYGDFMQLQAGVGSLVRYCLLVIL